MVVGGIRHQPLLEDVVGRQRNGIFISEEDDLSVKGGLGTDHNQIETIIAKLLSIIFDNILPLILINNRIFLHINFQHILERHSLLLQGIDIHV